jgi:DNA polymerase elongation subunit (family B)
MFSILFFNSARHVIKMKVSRTRTFQRTPGIKRADNPSSVTDIDYRYYISAQIVKPMKRFLDVLCAEWKSHVKF